MAAENWVEAVIEIPRGSRNKYEFDEATGVIRLDRVLYSSVHYPADPGFILDTCAEDGDPLDILVLVEEPTFPGCHVRARPIGVMRIRDEKGQDDKIVAVPSGDPRFAQVYELGDVSFALAAGDRILLQDVQSVGATGDGNPRLGISHCGTRNHRRGS